MLYYIMQKYIKTANFYTGKIKNLLNQTVSLFCRPGYGQNGYLLLFLQEYH